MLQVIILAAGHGKRMNSEIPKPLIKVRGKTILRHLVDSTKDSLVCNKPIIVIGQKAEIIKAEFSDSVEYVYQEEQLGTGHAVAVCKDKLKDGKDDILVLYADQPFLKPSSIKKLAETHEQSGATITLMTIRVEDFDDWRKPFFNYGRIIREDGKISEIIERKDASPKQIKEKELNPGYYCFNQEWLWKNIDKLKNDNVQKEYYLTDLVKMAIQQGQEIQSININEIEAIGVNSQEDFRALKEFGYF